jgi:hypothetical protein
LKLRALRRTTNSTQFWVTFTSFVFSVQRQTKNSNQSIRHVNPEMHFVNMTQRIVFQSLWIEFSRMVPYYSYPILLVIFSQCFFSNNKYGPDLQKQILVFSVYSHLSDIHLRTNFHNTCLTAVAKSWKRNGDQISLQIEHKLR